MVKIFSKFSSAVFRHGVYSPYLLIVMIYETSANLLSHFSIIHERKCIIVNYQFTINEWRSRPHDSVHIMSRMQMTGDRLYHAADSRRDDSIS